MATAEKKQLYIDLGTSFKSLLRSITIAMAFSYALQQYTNGFQHNTHFKAIFVAGIFVCSVQTIVLFLTFVRHLIDRNLLFMLELFLDFFSFAIAGSIGSFATARCEFDTPVKPCYHAIMRAPLIGTTAVGTLLLLIFTLTLLKK